MLVDVLSVALDDIRCVILMSSMHLSDGVLRCCHTDPELDAPIGQLALIDVWGSDDCMIIKPARDTASLIDAAKSLHDASVARQLA